MRKELAKALLKLPLRPVLNQPHTANGQKGWSMRL